MDGDISHHTYVHVHVHTSARVALIIICSLFAIYLFRVVVGSLKTIQFMLWCAMLDHLFCEVLHAVCVCYKFWPEGLRCAHYTNSMKHYTCNVFSAVPCHDGF